ncbi:hypothetical protein GCM10010211_55580 [Streptomyces albospinus]|uniref:Transposase n=1 Tax=Streptomyces albospinus TaxID=285515 RepID=A0ABQ2VFE9_9ACTN|nr:hypothetical protein GCM10010211_55580 [Streptomyces albospinus]
MAALVDILPTATESSSCEHIEVGPSEPWPPRARPDHVRRDKAYSSRRNRRCLRRRQVKRTSPERREKQAHRQRRGSGGGPTGFDPARYARRNEVERLINQLKISRALATRFARRAYVFHGTVLVAALRLWLCT